MRKNYRDDIITINEIPIGHSMIVPSILTTVTVSVKSAVKVGKNFEGRLYTLKIEERPQILTKV